MGYSPWGRKEQNTTEQLSTAQHSTYLNGLVVFPTFFNLSLNFAIRSSWSEPQSTPNLVFADCIELEPDMEQLKIGKGVWQGYTWSPCLFTLYAEYIMWNAGLDEAQAGIKIAGRNINNFRYEDDTILIAESEE